MCKILFDNEENCNMNIITRILFINLLMCLNRLFGTNFRRTWPKHYFAAVCLNLLVPFILQILYMETFETFVSNVFVNDLLESGHSLHFLLIGILCCVFYTTFIAPLHLYTSLLSNMAFQNLPYLVLSFLTLFLIRNPFSCWFYLCIFITLRFCIQRLKGIWKLAEKIMKIGI